MIGESHCMIKGTVKKKTVLPVNNAAGSRVTTISLTGSGDKYKQKFEPVYSGCCN